MFLIRNNRKMADLEREKKPEYSVLNTKPEEDPRSLGDVHKEEGKNAGEVTKIIFPKEREAIDHFC